MTNEDPGYLILLIDDEQNLLDGLKRVLTRNGFSVVTASNGIDGFYLAQDVRPDIIVCDVMMPGPDGFKVRQMLSDDPRTAHIPFIFLTARSAINDKLTGLGGGADDYITKPVDTEELQARIQAVLRRAEKGRQRGLAEANEKLEQLRQSIAANLSHELRTPLGILIGTLELALREKYGENSQDIVWYLEAALNSAHRLRNLVEDLIMITEIDQGRMNTFRESIDLRFNFTEPIQNCLKRWSFKNLNAIIAVESGMTLHAPRIGFTQVVCHMVDNAAKFSPDGGRIGISLKSNGQGGCILTVMDDGPGIPSRFREQVFERYYQVSQGDCREYGGLGVGLFLTRSFARALGGDAAIRDSERGCTIEMTLPPTTILELGTAE